MAKAHVCDVKELRVDFSRSHRSESPIEYDRMQNTCKTIDARHAYYVGSCIISHSPRLEALEGWT